MDLRSTKSLRRGIYLWARWWPTMLVPMLLAAAQGITGDTDRLITDDVVTTLFVLAPGGATSMAIWPRAVANRSLAAVVIAAACWLRATEFVSLGPLVRRAVGLGLRRRLVPPTGTRFRAHAGPAHRPRGVTVDRRPTEPATQGGRPGHYPRDRRLRRRWRRRRSNHPRPRNVQTGGTVALLGVVITLLSRASGPASRGCSTKPPPPASNGGSTPNARAASSSSYATT